MFPFGLKLKKNKAYHHTISKIKENVFAIMAACHSHTILSILLYYGKKELIKKHSFEETILFTMLNMQSFTFTEN